jgi:large subunit ribosomal protein L17
MRHQKQGRKFGRKSASRHALFSNMVSSLIEHERIETTDAKAKELRRIAERTITWATSVGSLVGGDKDKADAADRARVVHAMRMAQRVLKHRPSLEKLFSEIGPRFMGRPGGYTRIMKVRNRHGDAAPMSIIELVGRADESSEPGKGKTEKAEAKPKAAKVKAEAQPAKKKAAPKAEGKTEAAPKKKKAKPTEE